MVEFLFLDLDDTILDFHKAERVAINKTLRDFGLEPTEEVLGRYHVINKWHWEQLELGTLTRAEVQWKRFDALFSEFGVVADPQACAVRYMENLSIGHYFLPGAEEAVERLSKKYKLYLVSNGTAKVQDARLGGLTRRLEHCRDRLLDYADGKTDRIDELEEGLLPIRDTCICSWAEMISASPV